MGFKRIKRISPFGHYYETVYEDDAIDDIYRRLSTIKVDAENKIAELKELLKETEAKSEELRKKQELADPDSDESESLMCDLMDSLDEEAAIEDVIDALEKTFEE
jgi:hypothetical protein